MRFGEFGLGGKRSHRMQCGKENKSNSGVNRRLPDVCFLVEIHSTEMIFIKESSYVLQLLKSLL